MAQRTHNPKPWILFWTYTSAACQNSSPVQEHETLTPLPPLRHRAFRAFCVESIGRTRALVAHGGPQRLRFGRQTHRKFLELRLLAAWVDETRSFQTVLTAVHCSRFCNVLSLFCPSNMNILPQNRCGSPHPWVPRWGKCDTVPAPGDILAC